MDKQLHCFIFLGLFFIVSLVNSEDEQLSHPEQKIAVQCLLSNKTREIHIQCARDAAINIKSVFQGYQSIPPDTQVCTKQEKNECSVSEPEFYDTLVQKCSGRDDCLVPIKRIFLNPCGRISDYVQVDYECIPEDSPEQNIVDVCGDILHGKSIQRKSGYIHTPNYPALYPPDESCMCSLKQLTKGTQIKFSVLDMDIHSVNNSTCVGDWLEYTTPGEIWGRGVKMCNATRLNTTYVIGNNLELHFRADSMYESRGFWIKYEGALESGESVDMRLQCSQYHPSLNKEEGVCLSPDKTSELSLDCGDVGVIEITGSIHWTMIDLTSCPLATPTVTENCHDKLDQHPLMTSCMGQPKCNLPVTPTLIPKCGGLSNRYEVQYKCITDGEGVHNIVDVCGDALNGGDTNRKSGFIESPDYPHNYPPNVNCQCRLSTPEPKTTIQLRVIDLEFTEDSSVMCRNDWLEYTTDPGSWNRGIKICGGLQEEQVLDTDKSDIYLNFNSDSTEEYRGFWIQYSARMIEENIEVPVKVTCYKWLETDRIVVTGNKDVPTAKDSKTDKKSDKNTPLIVGLTVVILLMLALCIGMVLYKVKDSRKKYPPSQTTSIDTPLDKSYNSLKKYSTLNEEGRSADPGLRNKYPLAPDYQRSALAANQLSLPSSYINPVFEGSPVV